MILTYVLTLVGLIAHIVEYSSGIAEDMGSIPVQARTFQALFGSGSSCLHNCGGLGCISTFHPQFK